MSITYVFVGVDFLLSARFFSRSYDLLVIVFKHIFRFILLTFLV